MGTAAEKYEFYLRRLCALMKAGKSISDEADDMRDCMDDPWYEMTEEEHESARKLTAELLKD